MNWLRLFFILLIISGLTASCATKSGKEQEEISREYKYRDMPPAWGDLTAESKLGMKVP